VRFEVGHDFFLAAWFLRRVSQDFDTGVGFQDSSLFLPLVGISACCIGNYEKLGSGIGMSKALEVVLLKWSAGLSWIT
jgi:hypothetical protein